MAWQPTSLTLPLITLSFNRSALIAYFHQLLFEIRKTTVLGINLDTKKHDEYDDDFRLALYFGTDCTTTSWFAVIKNVQSHLTRNVHCDRS